MVELSPAELEAQIVAGGVRLVDVRESLEHWFDRIAGSESAPLSSFDPAEHVDSADRVVLYCRSGHRSGAAAARLSAASGRPIRHLAGGIAAWKASGRKVQRWGGPKPPAS